MITLAELKRTTPTRDWLLEAILGMQNLRDFYFSAFLYFLKCILPCKYMIFIMITMAKITHLEKKKSHVLWHRIKEFSLFKISQMFQIFFFLNSGKGSRQINGRSSIIREWQWRKVRRAGGWSSYYRSGGVRNKMDYDQTSSSRSKEN